MISTPITMHQQPPFESASWNTPLNDQGWAVYRVGTCTGQWRSTKDAYEILSFINDKPGNGDFAHTMDWFYESCKRDKKNLIIREVMNERLQQHLVKRGFTYAYGDNMIKRF